MKRRCVSCFFTDNSLEFQHHRCPQCDGDSELLGPFYVNTYLIDRAYGGPEEGGWYYSCGDPIDSRLCDSEEEMEKVRLEREAWCVENNKGRRSISSVLSDGEYQVVIEDHLAAPWPNFKPIYE